MKLKKIKNGMIYDVIILPIKLIEKKKLLDTRLQDISQLWAKV